MMLLQLRVHVFMLDYFCVLLFLNSLKSIMINIALFQFSGPVPLCLLVPG